MIDSQQITVELPLPLYRFLERLAVDELKRVAKEQISEKQQKRHLQHLEKNNLSADEQRELSELRRQANVLMLRKAYAWAILRWRGHPIPRLEEIPRFIPANKFGQNIFSG